MELHNEPREGIRCPRCQSGRWQLGMTPAKMPRAWCRKLYGGCGHSWAPWPDWMGQPGFRPISKEKIEVLERLLDSGCTNKRLMMIAAGIGKHSLAKYSGRWHKKKACIPPETS